MVEKRKKEITCHLKEADQTVFTIDKAGMRVREPEEVSPKSYNISH